MPHRDDTGVVVGAVALVRLMLRLPVAASDSSACARTSGPHGPRWALRVAVAAALSFVAPANAQSDSGVLAQQHTHKVTHPGPSAELDGHTRDGGAAARAGELAS